MSGFDERFEITCPCTGVLDYVPSLREARAYVHRHGMRCRDLPKVFDRMARHGAVDLREGRRSLTTDAVYLVGVHRRAE